MNWTKQQEDAICTRDRSVIVSAAAGSGKTAVLVERLLRILSDPAPDTCVRAEDMIVVTFTKDAANQMKQRLAKKISETLEEMNRSGQQQNASYEWLIRQRSALSNAKISTIHSFCFDFIRENADACGVSSQFSIAEPAREYIFKKRALQTVIENWCKERKQDISVLFNYFCIRNDSEIEKFILMTADYLNSLAFPSYWTAQARKCCQDGTVFADALRTCFLNEIQDCINLAEQSRDFAVSAFDKPDDRKYEIILDSDIAQMKAQQTYIQNADAETLLSDPLKYQIQKFKPFPGGKKNMDYYREEDKNIFAQIREIYRNKYTALTNSTLVPLRFWQEDAEIQKKVIPLLLEMTELYQDALFAEKQKQNVLSFDDAEHLVLKLLGSVDENGILHRSALAEAIADKYALIMIDEYQDSNDKQDCLFKLLSQGCRISQDGKTLHYGTNAFLVGDVKQSIYSFRQANPENFRRAIRDSVPLADCKHSEMARIYLNQNFRSASGILDFTNRMFREVMSEKCGELVYDEHEQLNFGASDYQKLLEHQYQGVQILLPKSSDGVKVTDLQAEATADTVARMIAEKFPVLDNGILRPCEYKDFCILFRSLRKRARILGEAFRKRGIPFACEEDDGFLTLPEIRFVMNLLRVLDNPMTDVAMAGVLLSPVYGFTPEDLAMLKVSGDGRRIYRQMQSLTEQENSVLSRKCREFLRQLAEMRALSDTMPLEKFIYEVYEMTDLMSLQSLWEHADERREHLELFAQYAQTYRENADLTTQSTLNGWLRYLDYLKESGEKFSANLMNKKANYVSVKTIHKSKGLEYPFVFLLHSERAFNKRPAPPPIMTAENGLLGLQMIDRERCCKITSASYQYLKYQQDKKEKSEEMRLLYVALTRAKQKLFLVMDEIYTGCRPKTHICNMGGFLENCPDVVKALAVESNSMQEWILAYLLSSDEADYLRKAMDEGKSIASSLAEYQVWYASADTQTSDSVQKTVLPAEPDAQLMMQMQKQLSYQYASRLTELPAKRSVTSLAQHQNADNEQINLPDFMLEDEEGRIRRLRGASRGTAIHKMMQFMDFQKASENPEAEIERMQNADILTSAEAEAIRPEKIRAFFSSELYHRIAVSDEVLKEKQLFVQIGRLNLPEDSSLLQNYLDTDGIMIGTVDLLFHEPDGWVIVDYKTDRVQEARQLTEKYALQLGLYQKAMELILHTPVKQAYLYSFELNEAIETDLSGLKYEI
ncbi:MAG: hypothetical protein E7496_09050 [Ruminococcus sp.]|nr:hypothetical protein [Ruminococcus sp.]